MRFTAVFPIPAEKRHTVCFVSPPQHVKTLHVRGSNLSLPRASCKGQPSQGITLNWLQTRLPFTKAHPGSTALVALLPRRPSACAPGTTSLEWYGCAV